MDENYRRLEEQLRQLEREQEATLREHGMKIATLQGEMRVALERSLRYEAKLSDYGEAIGYGKAAQKLFSQGLRDLRKTVDRYMLRKAPRPPAAGEHQSPPPAVQE